MVDSYLKCNIVINIAPKQRVRKVSLPLLLPSTATQKQVCKKRYLIRCLSLCTPSCITALYGHFYGPCCLFLLGIIARLSFFQHNSPRPLPMPFLFAQIVFHVANFSQIVCAFLPEKQGTSSPPVGGSLQCQESLSLAFFSATQNPEVEWQ